MAALRSELDMGDEADPQEVLVAAGKRLADLSQDVKRRYVEERITRAMRAGKLVEAQRAWAEALVAHEEGLFDEWLRTAPVVVQPGSTAPPQGSAAGERRRALITSRARAEFRASPVLSGLTTEEAYVADALREAS